MEFQRLNRVINQTVDTHLDVAGTGAAAGCVAQVLPETNQYWAETTTKHSTQYSFIFTTLLEEFQKALNFQISDD